ncbi:unnamed protein product [Ceutorhynchus assimilis]|uniref:Uncharacterized protein n=1 Tax=Ceutorhynchus assimilis TaxID=467358 RepID=A0A9N9MRE7_9CUCU|nr:unnamed protein product [Ceutorhynchus assimilis]
MALKSSKITSEVLQTCNRLVSSNVDATLKTIKIPATIEAQKHREEASLAATSRFRYRIANTEKPVLPDINMRDGQDITQFFAHLQPGATPEFGFYGKPPKWVEKPVDNSPFPATIQGKPKIIRAYTDQQKAEDKMLKYKLTYLQSLNRNYSTGHHYRYYSKEPANNSGSGNCKKTISKCVKVKPKKPCKMSDRKACPRLKLNDCNQSPGSNCKLNYLDPNCVKKFAPYPSYSEACAENLPEDPSECHQCPWRTCDDADTIEPGKPVRNKRNYSTSCSRHLDAPAGVALPTFNGEITDYLVKGKDGRCGQVKKPCKQPKGPCEIRRDKEALEKHEREKLYKPDKKKAEGLVLISDKEFILDAQFDSTDVNPSVLETEGSWIDIVGTGMSLDGKTGGKKPKPPNCPKHKKPKRPDIDSAIEIKRRCDPNDKNRKNRDDPNFY